MNCVELTARTVLRVDGEDAKDFLQNLITNDMELLAGQPAIYTALLSPQGKCLFDFFIIAHDGGFLLDCDGSQAGDLLKRLTMYKLRSRVELKNVSEEYRVAALFGGDESPMVNEGVLYPDPRHAKAGWRLIAGAEAVSALPNADMDSYDAHRYELGLSDGARDIPSNSNFFMELNGDLHHGIGFEKGCFVGQETTARMNHRDLVRKRLLPVDLAGPADEGAQIVTAEGGKVGELRSHSDRAGLALIRLEYLEQQAEFLADGVALTVRRPDWLA